MYENVMALSRRATLKTAKIAMIVALLVGCSSATAEANATAADSPNILIIVADQMRRPAMGFWREEEYQRALNGVSDPVITPNIDSLAAEGIVFTQAIANYPLCSPFRAMLLSGLYPNKNGVDTNTRKDRDIGLRTDIETLPEVLKSAGYETAFVGKAHWHKNEPLFDADGNYQGTTEPPGGYYIAETDYDTYIPPGPNRHGFDYWYQSISHAHRNPVIFSNDPSAIAGKADGERHQKGIYSTIDQADRIADYLSPSQDKRDVNKPFFLLWGLDPPHSPYESLEDTDAEIYEKYYQDEAIEDLLNRPNADHSIGKKYIRYYLSMITLIDREIGRIIERLKEEGLYDNTIIVFTSDHGEMMGSHGETGKNKVLEESLGIPFIVSYPRRLAHRIDNLLFGIPDVMPTLLGLSGLSDQIPSYRQGSDFSPLLLDPNSQLRRRVSSFYFGPKGQVGVRTLQYTFAVDRSGEVIALYDNLEDPYQLTNLTLQTIPREDRKMLKTQLGFWLCATQHDWYAEKRHSKRIKYPANKNCRQ
mgnify:FL=1